MTDIIRTLEEIIDLPVARGGLDTSKNAFMRRTLVCFDGEKTVQVYRQVEVGAPGYALVNEINPYEGWTARRRSNQRADEWLPHILDEITNPFAVVFCEDEGSPEGMAAMVPGAYNNPHLHPCVQGTFGSQIEAARFVQKAWMKEAQGTVMEGMMPNVDRLIEHGYIMDPRSVEQARAITRTGKAESVSGWTIVDRAAASEQMEREHTSNVQASIDMMAQRNRQL